jgi:translocation and assembly module TamB
VRSLARALGRIGWGVLGALALAGLALSAVAALTVAPFARPLVASTVIRFVDEAIAGRLELEGITLLPGGELELRGLRVFDPDGHLVVAVGRARLLLDVTALRRRTVGVVLELDAPSVLLEEEPDGGTSLARAFGPPGPARPEQAARGGGGVDTGGWTLHLSRLEVHGGDLWWRDAAGGTRAEATGIEVAARGTVGPRRARAELRLRAELRAPLATPVSLEVAAEAEGDAVRVPVLRLDAGGTSLEAFGEGDLSRRAGRAAVTRLGVSRAQARALVPAAPAGADLSAAGYGEADGATLTAALHVEPAGADGAGGRGDAAVAARQAAPGRAAGFDVALARLDPSRLAATLPAGEVTLAAHGAAAGATLDDLRARVALAVSRSRIGRGEVARADVALRVARGTFELDRLSAAAPGVTVDASGRWTRGGPVSGTAALEVADLAAAARNAAHLAGGSAPEVAGRATLRATLSGTSAAPALEGRLDADVLGAGTVAAEGVHLSLRAAGPRADASGRAEGRIAAVRAGGAVRARQIALRAGLAGGEGSLSFSASVPGAGEEPLAVEARGRLDRAGALLEVRELALSYPGTRWTLARPATVDLRAPAVDRLELADAPQRLALSGGLGPRGALSARLELARLDLARLPAGLLPAEGVRGEVSGSVEASGTTALPVVAARLSVEDGGWGRIGGVAASADGSWDGAARRVSGTVSAARKAGGTVDARLDLPVPLAGRPDEPVRGRIRATALPLAVLLAATGRELPADGTLGLDLRVDGTAGAPAAVAEATLEGGVFEDLDGLGAAVSVEAVGPTAHVRASGTLGGRRIAAVEADAPLDLGELVARPAEGLDGLRRAPVHATLSVLSLDLATVSGRAGVPRDLAGVLEAHAALEGTPAAPRARAALAVTGGAVGQWRGLGASVEATAGDAGLAAEGRVAVQGEEAIRFRASLAARPASLGDRAALAAAPLRVDAEIPRVALGRAGGDVLPLEGTLEGRLAVAGTLGAPEVSADLAGAGVVVKGHPLGEATASARYARARGEAELTLRPRSGGVLRGNLAVAADLGLGGGGPALADAPAEATVVAEALDLGFLPAIAPGVVRGAGGIVALDVRAEGPLRRMTPRGTLHVAGGRLSVVELGEWTDVAIDARVGGDDLELQRFDVRRGRGTLSASGAARGLRSGAAKLSARLAASGFTVTRAGMELATFDLDAEATGTWTADEVVAEVRVPKGTVRLPKRTPRTLQPLDRRADIVVGRRAERRTAPPAGAAAERPLAIRVGLVAPGKLFVKSDDPEIDVELRADVHYEREEGGDYVRGSVEVVRGKVEPIGGRIFVLDRGAVRFTNGPPEAALLDFQAKYTNPAAVITAKVTGTLRSPDIKLLSSVPQMTEQDIALLLLTGRTEAKAGSGGVGTITGEEAGKAVLGVLATQTFKNLVQDKLPLDTVAVDAGGFRAGKYVTDRIYVAYVRRWDADPTKYQNEDEVRVEYQITPRWMFESRYGSAQSGSANLIWSRDY